MKLTLENLHEYKHIHLIGIGGVSMSAIAETLNNWNYTVTGSDAAQSELTDRLNSHGINVVIGHDLKNSKNADLIIFSAAISDEDPEMIIAKENNIPTIGRGEFVGLLTQKYKESICVAGTHGKTTTTSMISICFVDAQKDPTVQVGAILKNIGGNYVIGNSKYFILESCEYKGNFLKFFPHTGIILNIDNDHLDYYKTFDNVKKAFQDFSLIIENDGLLVTNADDENCLALKDIVKCNFLSYGIENENANYVAKNISYDKNGFATFDVYKNNNLLGTISLSVAGRHNILNALACITTCDYHGIEFDSIAKSLKSFTGASRRLEYKGELNSCTIIDDYAHHPTEIEATAVAIQNKEYNKSWVVFQPHTYSRTKGHLDAFANSLLGFDNIILLDIYAAREKNTFDISSKDLENKINSLVPNKAIYMPDFNEVVSYLKENISENDIIITLGAGTVTEIGPMLLK